jgi:hypothetical protein
MKAQRILSLVIAIVVLGSTLVFVQCSDGTTEQQNRQMKFVKVDRETPEMQAKRAEFYKRGEERINKAVAEGKIEQVKASFLLKAMANDKAFKDANPEWTKYFFGKKHAGKKVEGKKDGKKFEGKKDGKKWEGKKDGVKKDRANKADRPKLTPAEKKAKYEKFYQKGIEKINQRVKDGKMDTDRAAFMLKWIANDKAFKDANPDWADYSFGRKFHGKKGQNCAAKKAK